jgi:hypothetical protein
MTTDAERLRLALVNLIVNARQAVEIRARALAALGHAPPTVGQTLPGPATEPQVLLSTRATSGGVSIVVADSGAGIATADLPRVFDPYFTTKRGGTGLGLPIAKNIIEGLGGAISITSAPGRGTEMRIDLPLAFAGASAELVRLEQDSRGFQLLKTGPVGGDSGGYFTHHWEAPAVTYKGKKVRLTGSTFIASPVNHRLRMQIAVDDQPSGSYGATWWRRQESAPR